MHKSNEPETHAESKVDADRRILREAQQRGTGATLGAYVRLSGPGWLQSAITLGGGSLAGALFLGALGGVSMLWLQLVAIALGVIMLSAIAFVTLSTGQRPFSAINQHINPALGWGWLIATSLANMIWCMPQFSLCYAAIESNFLPGDMSAATQFNAKLAVSGALLAVVACVVAMNARRGVAAKIFDILLKCLVGMIVICFFAVVVVLAANGKIDWAGIAAGFIPNPSQWTNPSAGMAELLSGLSSDAREFWTDRVVRQQRSQMIAAAATAVGINMTFLMPYSMLHRGWDKTFRGLARFDLMTGMAIPYVLVTSCVVIASANAFHAQADPAFLSADAAEFQTSPTFGNTKDTLLARVKPELKGEKFDAAVKDMPEAEREALVAAMAALPENEKLIAASMVQRNAAALAKSLEPAIGKDFSPIVFGIGVFGMGFSTIIILMLINGFVFCEASGKPESGGMYALGCGVAGVVGASWPFIWSGDSQFWFTIIASTFGAMLLPVAYITFFMMMNSKSLMGAEKPRGASMIIWNVLMVIAVAGACINAASAIYDKATDTTSARTEMAGYVVIGIVAVYLVIVALGFVLKRRGLAEPGKAA